MVEDCGGALVGGHTVHSVGTLFGLSVTGLVHPDRIWRTRGAQVGDVLVLSRPIGVGVAISHASERSPDHGDVVARIRRPVLAEAATLASLGERVHAVTDVTGFGLLGHALDLVGDEIGLVVEQAHIPVLPVALDLARQGHRTSAHESNLHWVRSQVEAGFLTEERWALLVDPQTTGGLLAAIAPGPIPGGFVQIGRFVPRRLGDPGLTVDDVHAHSGAA